MTQATTPDAPRPAPGADRASAPFFDALRAHRLLIQRCASCGIGQLARRRCIFCGGDTLAWEEASGRATLVSFGIVHGAAGTAFGRSPYNVAVAELQEGPQIYTQVVDVQARELRIGMLLRVVYLDLESGGAIPVFSPA